MGGGGAFALEASVELLLDVLHAAPQVKIVVTSRVRTNLSCEQLVQVGSLACPRAGSGDAWLDNPRTVTQNSAVQLFLSGARRIRPDLALAAEVETFLVDIKPKADVRIDKGAVVFRTKTPVGEDSDLVKIMSHIVRKIPAVRGIKVVTENASDDVYPGQSDPMLRSAKGKSSPIFTDLG